MKWWEKEPLRIIEIFDCFDLKRLSPEEIARAVKKLGGNSQHFHCMQHSTKIYGSGLDDRSLYFNTSAGSAQNPDRLTEYIPYAKKYKIKIIVYFNVHWYTIDFGKRHPDWVQIKQDGQPIDNVYGTGTSFCINSPYREWVFQILKDLCKYEINGIFYDGPIFFSNTCYCNTCQKLFRAKTGENLPQKSDRNHPLWKNFIEFQAESMEKFLEESNNIIKGINPELLFYMNGNSNWPYWPTGRDNHRIIKHTDILGAEGGFIYGDLNQTPIFKPAIAGKLLSSQANNKPTVIFDCADHKPWSWYVLPEAEISLLLCETCFSGSNYWFAVCPDDINQPEMKAISRFGNFIKKYPDAFYKTESLSNVALVWPTKSAESYTGSSVPLTDFTSIIEGEEIGNLHMEFDGFYEALSRIYIPFDVIDENNFDFLDRYKLIVLPNTACLSLDDCEKIKKFVFSGGNIVGSFETSLYDEAGKIREDFGLSDVMGIQFNGNIFGKMGHDYVSPVKNIKSRYLKDIKKILFPAPDYGISVKETTGNTEIFFCKRMKGRYDGIPEVSNDPMMVVNKYGKGTSIYLAGSFGKTIANFRFIEYFTILKNICDWLSSQYVFVEDNKNVEIFLRKKGDSIFLYLINMTNGLKRPIKFLQTLYNVKLKLKETKPVRLFALKSETYLKHKKTRDGIEFVVPELNNFEIIKILTGVKNEDLYYDRS